MKTTKRGDVIAIRVRHSVMHPGSPTNDDWSWYLGRAERVRRNGTVFSARTHARSADGHARSADGVVHIGALLRTGDCDTWWECRTITSEVFQAAAKALLGSQWETVEALQGAILAHEAQEEDTP